MPARKNAVRILLVDDHPLVREGIATRLLLQKDIEVCGEAENEDEALEKVKTLNPDLVIVDMALKQGHGLDVIKRIKSRFPQVKMLVVSGFQESLYAERALRAGALGYLNKQQSNEKLVEAVRTVLDGRRFVSQELVDRLFSQVLDGADQAKMPIETLSNRELEIFRMIGEGLTTGTIADQLFLSTHTIDSHREHIKRKLGLANAGELSRAAVEWVLESS